MTITLLGYTPITIIIGDPFHIVFVDVAGVVVAILPHFISQVVFGVMYSYIHLGPKYPSIERLLPLSFIMPLILAMLPLPYSILKHSPAFAAIMPLALAKIALWSSSFDIYKTLHNGLEHAKSFATNFGLSALIENEWQRLNVPCVLRAFWTIRLVHFYAKSMLCRMSLFYCSPFSGFRFNNQRCRASNLIDSFVEENVGDFGHRTNTASAWMRNIDGCPWHDQHRLIDLLLHRQSVPMDTAVRRLRRRQINRHGVSNSILHFGTADRSHIAHARQTLYPIVPQFLLAHHCAAPFLAQYRRSDSDVIERCTQSIT